MSAYGVPETDVARVLGVDGKTLRKHYREELDTGGTKATAKVAEVLFRKAMTEGPRCVAAAIFWLKTRGTGRRPCLNCLPWRRSSSSAGAVIRTEMVPSSR